MSPLQHDYRDHAVRTGRSIRELRARTAPRRTPPGAAREMWKRGEADFLVRGGRLRYACDGSAVGVRGESHRLEARRWRARERRWGITKNEWLAMVEAQRFRCAVSGCEGEPTALDHDHTHDERDPAGWRGIVCRHHNLCQGHAERLAGCAPHAQARTLRALASYLERWAGLGEAA